MDDVQVELVQAEPSQAPLGFRDRVAAPWLELRRDEDVLACDTALAQSPADALLVAVRLSGVDVPVAELERPPDSFDALRPVRHLPDPEAEERDLVPIRERTHRQRHREIVAARRRTTSPLRKRGLRWTSGRHAGRSRCADRRRTARGGTLDAE